MLRRRWPSQVAHLVSRKRSIPESSGPRWRIKLTARGKMRSSALPCLIQPSIPHMELPFLVWHRCHFLGKPRHGRHDIAHFAAPLGLDFLHEFDFKIYALPKQSSKFVVQMIEFRGSKLTHAIDSDQHFVRLALHDLELPHHVKFLEQDVKSDR